jgi:hypothetical protein
MLCLSGHCHAFVVVLARFFEIAMPLCQMADPNLRLSNSPSVTEFAIDLQTFMPARGGTADVSAPVGNLTGQGKRLRPQLVMPKNIRNVSQEWCCSA